MGQVSAERLAVLAQRLAEAADAADVEAALVAAGVRPAPPGRRRRQVERLLALAHRDALDGLWRAAKATPPSQPEPLPRVDVDGTGVSIHALAHGGPLPLRPGRRLRDAVAATVAAHHRPPESIVVSEPGFAGLFGFDRSLDLAPDTPGRRPVTPGLALFLPLQARLQRDTTLRLLLRSLRRPEALPFALEARRLVTLPGRADLALRAAGDDPFPARYSEWLVAQLPSGDEQIHLLVGVGHLSHLVALIGYTR